MPFLANAHNLASLHQNLNIPTSNVLWWRGHAHTINVAMFTLGPHFNAHSKINSGPVLIPLNKLENFKACGWFSFFRGYYSQRMVPRFFYLLSQRGKGPFETESIVCLLPVAPALASRVQETSKITFPGSVIMMSKYCVFFLLQAGKPNCFISYSQNLGRLF